MEKAHLTKQYIADKFRSLAKETSIDKISVQDILDAAQISRKTFYYHFQNKQDLVIWIFRSGLAGAIKETCQQATIADAGQANHGDVVGSRPFYPDQLGYEIEEAFTSYCSCLIEYLYQNKSFFINAFNSASQNNLSDYLHDLIYQCLLYEVNRYTNGQNVGEHEKELLAGYFTHACAGSILTWIKTGMKHRSNLSTLIEVLPPITSLCLGFAVRDMVKNHRGGS